MVKFFVKPSRSASARSMRTHMAVEGGHPHASRARGPRAAARRSRISAAALLVKVMARISHGATPVSCSRMLAMRYVSTRVLPEPAPASTRSGPFGGNDRLALGAVQGVDVDGHGSSFAVVSFQVPRTARSQRAGGSSERDIPRKPAATLPSQA